MTTTITQLKDRAVAWSSANGLQSLVSDTAEIINRVAADERALFDLAAATNSYYFANTVAVRATIAKGSGASANHTAIVSWEILNANSSGVTVA